MTKEKISRVFMKIVRGKRINYITKKLAEIKTYIWRKLIMALSQQPSPDWWEFLRTVVTGAARIPIMIVSIFAVCCTSILVFLLVLKLTIFFWRLLQGF